MVFNEQNELLVVARNKVMEVLAQRVRAHHPVPGGIFTAGINLRITRWRRATRRPLICGLKTVRGLGILAERYAASRVFRFAAGL
jgi:hypothetical protein